MFPILGSDLRFEGGMTGALRPSKRKYQTAISVTSSPRVAALGWTKHREKKKPKLHKIGAMRWKETLNRAKSLLDFSPVGGEAAGPRCNRGESCAKHQSKQGKTPKSRQCCEI